MNTYVKQYVRNCILNRKVIPSIIRKEILPEFNRNNIKKYANLFSNTYDTLNYAWFTINKQGIEDRITFIKLMIDLVNKKIEQENN